MRFAITAILSLVTFAEAARAPGKWASCRMCSEDRFGPCGVVKFYQKDAEENALPNPVKMIGRMNAVPTANDGALCLTNQQNDQSLTLGVEDFTQCLFIVFD